MIFDDALYKEYQPKVFGYLISRVNNSTTAEDLCSEVFLKVCSKIESFDETKASLSTWIFTVTRNTLTDFFRSNRWSDEIPETFADDSDLEEEVCNSQMLEILADSLEKLPERERDIILLHYYRGRTLRDIAELMGISYSYVKILHNTALTELRNYF